MQSFFAPDDYVVMKVNRQRNGEMVHWVRVFTLREARRLQFEWKGHYEEYRVWYNYDNSLKAFTSAGRRRRTHFGV